MKKLTLVRVIASVFITFTLALCAQAQNLGLTVDLSATNGWEPYASVVQGPDGNFYGAGTGGIGVGAGNMFRVTPTGELTSIYQFCSQPNCTDGGMLLYSPVVGPDGNLYGVTTVGGGPGGEAGQAGGTIFRMALDGTYTVIYTFCSVMPNCADGATSNGIILGSDGNFYGTTVYGGINEDGPGVIFKVTSEGALTVLHSFCSDANCADGEKPFYPPVEGNDGNFYGVAGNAGGGGVFYKVTSSGQYSVLYSFCDFTKSTCPNGSYPYAIVKDADGNFVGTACCGSTAYGVVFKITPTGKYTVLHHFGPNALGSPSTPLILASDGNLYGTLTGGGSGSWVPPATGGIYEITSKGEFKAVHGFCRTCSYNGFNLLDPLFQGTDGNLYGTTAFGGVGGWHGEAYGFGTVFQLADGLPPFVQTIPAGAKVGAGVLILGTHLIGTSRVTFNGAPAQFTVESDTYIRAIVPVGAKTGKVAVVTASGSLDSSSQFLVTK